MTGLFVVLSLSLVLILVNALFVAAEFALIGSPKTSLEGRASQGDRFAARILRTLTSPKRQDEYIAASQLGITLASLGLGMYGEHRLAGIFEQSLAGVVSAASVAALASTAALALLTVGHIVLGLVHPRPAEGLSAQPGECQQVVAVRGSERARRVEHEPDRPERRSPVHERQQRRGLRLRAHLGEAREATEDGVRGLQPQWCRGAHGLGQWQLRVQRERAEPLHRALGVTRGVRELQRPPIGIA